MTAWVAAAAASTLAGTHTASAATTDAAPDGIHSRASLGGHDRTQPPRVTWDGWRGVNLATPLTKAHRELGGTLELLASDYGCGDVLTTTAATLDGNIYSRPHRFGTIRPNQPLRYPLGTRSSMTSAKVTRLIRASDYTLHTKKFDEYGTGVYTVNAWVTGPHGHTLYFTYTDGQNIINRFGLSISKKVAIGQMNMNGC